jgi:hypothetical protein
MDEKEKSRRWEELISNEGVVRSKEKRVRSKKLVVGVGVGRSYLSDLWLLVILEVVGCGLLCIVEILG